MGEKSVICLNEDFDGYFLLSFCLVSVILFNEMAYRERLLVF